MLSFWHCILHIGHQKHFHIDTHTYTDVYKHTLANRSPSTNCRHLSSTSRHPHCSQLRLRGIDPMSAMPTQAWVLACGSPTFSLWSPSQDAVGCMSKWRKASLQLPAPPSCPRNLQDGSTQPPNNSLFLILPLSVLIFHFSWVGNPSISHSEPSSL